MKTGEKTSDLVTLNNRVFGMPLREDILQRVVVWQLAKRRQGTHCVKTLSEVSGSNRKPFPQKGTGRARQGQKRYESMRSARMQSSSDARRLQADGTASARLRLPAADEGYAGVCMLLKRSSIAGSAHGAVAEVAGAELNHCGLVRAGERKDEGAGELAAQNHPERSGARDRRK